MLLLDFAKMLVAPKPVLEKRLMQERFFSMLVLVSLFSVILAIFSVSFFRAEDMKSIAGIEINTDTYEAFKIFMLLGTAFLACLTPAVVILINSLLNKLLLWILRVPVTIRQLYILGILAYIPMLLDTVLRIIIQFIIQKPMLQSPASIFSFFFADGSGIQKILSTFTVFGLWSMLLYAFGLFLLLPEKVRWRGVAVVAFSWVIFSLISGFISATNQM